MIGAPTSPRRACGTIIRHRRGRAWFAFLDSQLGAGHNGAGPRIPSKQILPDMLPSRLIRKIKHFQPTIISAVLPRTASF
jgi:hypothetical protein